MTTAVRCDITVNGLAPVLRLWLPDGDEVRYQLTASEAAALIRRIAGSFEAAYRPDHDRTQETYTANPHLAELHQAT